MEQHRLTVVGAKRRVAGIERKFPAVFRHVEWLEHRPGRWVGQFDSEGDISRELEALSRTEPRLIFLWEYERRRTKGLAKVANGRVTRTEIKY